jgi:hypothetical protein
MRFLHGIWDPLNRLSLRGATPSEELFDSELQQFSRIDNGVNPWETEGSGCAGLSGGTEIARWNPC